MLLYLTMQYIYSQRGGWCYYIGLTRFLKWPTKTPNLSLYQVTPGKPKFTGFLIQGEGEELVVKTTKKPQACVHISYHHNSSHCLCAGNPSNILLLILCAFK